jgi:hypothetical protein
VLVVWWTKEEESTALGAEGVVARAVAEEEEGADEEAELGTFGELEWNTKEEEEPGVELDVGLDVGVEWC